MGDPKKIRKKYQPPRHPWERARIDEEKKLKKEYGFSNNKEIWKIKSKLKGFKDQSKKLAAGSGKQVEKETAQLLQKLKNIGLLTQEHNLGDILGIGINEISDRRLQTIVYKKKLSRSIKQARQLIVHRHITVNNLKINSPSYIVSISEEPTVSFSEDSPLTSDDHPERVREEIAQKPEEKEELAIKKQKEEQRLKKTLEKETGKNEKSKPKRKDEAKFENTTDKEKNKIVKEKS